MKVIIYKKGFFVLLVLFFLFWLWMFASVANRKNPRDFIKSVFTNYRKELNIIDGVYQNKDNSFAVKFNVDMDTSYYEYRGHSINNQNRELDYSNIYWADNRTFKLQLNRSLTNEESFMIKYRFKDIYGRVTKSVELRYE